jgi:hypothetical protein
MTPGGNSSIRGIRDMKHNKKELLAKRILISNLVRNRRCLETCIDSYRADFILERKKLNNLKKLIGQWNKKEASKTIILAQLTIQVAEIASSKDNIHQNVSHATVVMPRLVDNMNHSYTQLKQLSHRTLTKQDIEAIIASKTRAWIVATAAIRNEFLLVYRQELSALENDSIAKQKKNSPSSQVKSEAALGLGTVLAAIQSINSNTTAKTLSELIHSIVMLKDTLEKTFQIKNTTHCIFSQAHRVGKIGINLQAGLANIVKSLRYFKHFLKKKEDAINADQMIQESIPLVVYPDRTAKSSQMVRKPTSTQWSPLHFQLASTTAVSQIEDRYERKH